VPLAPRRPGSGGPGQRRRAPLPAALLAALALAAPPRAAAATFVDPLDAPARPSALAAARLLTGVASAGGRLVAVGARGHALWSDDGGRSWSQGSVPVSSDLTAVHLLSPERGFAVGHDGVVLETGDGGRSWALRLDGRRLAPLLLAAYPGAAGPRWLPEQVAALAAPGAARSLLDVWFDDERNGFAVGAFGLALRTGDAGRSWQPLLHLAENPRGMHLYAVRRIAGALYLAGEQGLVLKLDPATGRFRALAVGHGGSFFGIAGAGGAVLAFGLRGAVLRSSDGGASWRRVPSGVEVALTGATLAPGGTLLLLAQTGELLASADEGASFRAARPGDGAPAAGLVAIGAGEAVIVGLGGVRRERLP
jgi:photosystem II stability/assembly factor-like uncharacterized protein